ncbi:MAG TPA: transaldolase family protein [Dissulfurispiraceae bacterium]|nr:transaldolase family protein [Dissulfurispiraceae bacterium]
MRPSGLKTKIFLDSGDPLETRDIIGRLGFLDGQTTNPTLIANNPEAKARLQRGEKFSEKEIYDFYRGIVTEISGLMPSGSVSVEVYADRNTKAEQMLEHGKEMFTWIPNAHLKFPTTAEGLKAAEIAVKMGLRVNMTLCFKQEQAAAVYDATRGAKKGDVFVSPFVGRLDDLKENGMDLLVNIIKMFESGDHHVEVLSASIRSFDHFYYSIALGCDIVTAPGSILKKWSETGIFIPEGNFVYNSSGLAPIAYKNIDLTLGWRDFDIDHDLTDKGMERFSHDWNLLIAR